MRNFFLLLVTVFSCHSVVFAQGGHYWTQQYGTRSMLLSGSVIGGVEDLGAVYYNPARLGFIKNPAFLLSADVYEWTRLRFENTLEENVNLNKSEFDGVPSLAAGTFKLSFLENHHFAYAVLSRQRSNISFNYRVERVGDVIDSWPGEETFEGDTGLNTSVKEDWFGGSWSHALNDKVSLGASGFFVIANSKKGSLVHLRGLSESNDVATYFFNRNFNYYMYSIIWKLAAAFQFEKVDLGLTLTTPSINLRGSSSYNYQLLFSGIGGVSAGDDIFSTSYQSGLNTTLKSPLAIGAGGTFKIKRAKIHLSTEFYSKVPEYTLFKVNDHSMQSRPDTSVSFQLVEKLNSVMNFGAGLEWAISEKVSAYTSASTDFSTVDEWTNSFFQNKSKISNSTIEADFYHFGSGVVLTLKGADLTIGATHTGSRQEIGRPVSFPGEGGNDEGIFDPSESAKLKWSRWRFVLSFSITFLKDFADEKLENPQNNEE